MAIEGCKQVYEVQREALKKKYGMIEKTKADDETDKEELIEESKNLEEVDEK
jgi:hypothetical protein